MRWVDDQGPENNAIAQNELGDWFTRAVLERSDNNGGGVKFVENAAESGTFAFTFVTSGTDTRTGGEKNTTHTFTVPHWNTLSIKGSYNAACSAEMSSGIQMTMKVAHTPLESLGVT